VGSCGSWDTHPGSDPLSLLFQEVRPGRPSPTRGPGVSPCGPTRVRGARSPHQPAAMVTSASSYAPTWTPPPPSSSWPGGGCPSSITVGDGSCLPVTSVGSAHGPFRLSDVLVAPQMVHNLLSIRQFTADNSCSVEFDTSGLSVKDLATVRPLLRCDSTGPLYTLRLPVSAASTSP
jgi:hypothetical protein